MRQNDQTTAEMNPNARLVCYGADLVGIFIFVLGSQVSTVGCLTFPWLGGRTKGPRATRDGLKT